MNTKSPSTTQVTVAALLLFGSGACANRESPPGNDISSESSEISQSANANLTFVDSSEDFPNPERGYYVGMDLVNAWAPSTMRAKGRSLAIALIRLDAFR